MRRRQFITLLGGAAAAWPLGAHGQPPAKLPTVGFIGSDSPDAYAVLLRAFRVGLKATGFIEDQNVAIEYRWAEGRNDKLPEFAVDLVRRQVAVIVAPTTPSVLAAKAATKTIPIVFFTAGDPVDLGLVASLSRPDSNLTGATTLTLEVGPKWLQFLHEMVPRATRRFDTMPSMQAPLPYRSTNTTPDTHRGFLSAEIERRVNGSELATSNPMCLGRLPMTNSATARISPRLRL